MKPFQIGSRVKTNKKITLVDGTKIESGTKGTLVKPNTDLVKFKVQFDKGHNQPVDSIIGLSTEYLTLIPTKDTQ